MATKTNKSRTSKSATARTRAGAKAPRKTKKQTCLGLLRRPKGASMAELRKATGWQAHTVRGFLSGTVRKALGLTLRSEAAEGKLRRYRVTGQAAKG